MQLHLQCLRAFLVPFIQKSSTSKGTRGSFKIAQRRLRASAGGSSPIVGNGNEHIRILPVSTQVAQKSVANASKAKTINSQFHPMSQETFLSLHSTCRVVS